MTYEILTAHSVVNYVLRFPEVASHFHDHSSVEAREVGDGNLNLVFIVQSSSFPDDAVIVKQAIPYLRVAGEAWPLSRERMRFESQALLLYHELVPGLVPQVYTYEEAMSAVIMEYLSNHEVMRKPLINRQKFPLFADHLSTFLANVLFRTSDLALTGLEKKTSQSKFINPHLCKIQEDFVFTNPYMESPENKHNPLIDEEVQAVRRNTDLKLAIADLKEKFMTQGQALIHSDLHTGSIMVNQTDTRVIDPEFCFYGPMGYDIGAVMSNLMMNYAAHFAHTPDPAARQDYQAYLIDTMRQLWNQFAAKFDALWVNHNQGELVPTGYWQFEGGDHAFRQYRERYLRTLLRDTFGLGACESLRRTMGIVTVSDVGSIADLEARAQVEGLIIRVSTRWILEHGTFTSVEDALRVVAEESV